MTISLFRRAIFLSTLYCAGAAWAPDAHADDAALAAQRERFPLVLETAKRAPDDSWLKLASGLETYPLYPYIELAALQRRTAQLKRGDVERYLKAWPDSLPGQMLRDAFLVELARRGEWSDFLALVPDAPRSKELQCAKVQARLSSGKAVEFKRDVEPLWLSASALPSACDGVLAWATAQHKLGADLIWSRIDLAARAGNGALVGTLAAMLDGAERAAAERHAEALQDPNKLLGAAATLGDSPRMRAAVTLAFERLARRDSEAAETHWAALSTQFHFDTDQRGRILRALALYRATSYAPDALARLNALPAELTDDSTREWRVRVALAAQDYASTLTALDALSPTQQADARWRYLRARVLSKLERKTEADKALASVATEANFHGFLAADWLKQPYAICQTDFSADAAQAEALRQQPSLARAFEFFALGRLSEARREWDFAVASLKPAERRVAADLASSLGWYDRAVYTFNQSDDLHLYALRFPLARRDQIVRAANAAKIDPSWAYAIIRAESAWTTDAHSSADAWGLMQLLPGTAAQLAKANRLRYGGSRDLLDPDTNITLGTRYLGNMAQHYDGSPWLASAAYNAGVDPVGRWIDARDALDPDFFIETIPYKETREYVARVLAFSVIYDWRLHGSALSLSSKLPRIGKAYEAPVEDAPRKAIICPTSSVPQTAGPVGAASPAVVAAEH